LPVGERAHSVQPLYVGVALVLVALAIAMYHSPLPERAEAAKTTDSYTFSEVLKPPHVRFGVLAMFLYVGTEVALGSFLANLAMRPDIGAIPPEKVGRYVSMYWLSAMIGRFIGAALLLKADARRLLSLYASINIALLIVSLSSGGGGAALWTVIATGLFNSIMFPTLFTLIIDGLGPLIPKASSLSVTAICGRAVIPLLQGHLVDSIQARTNNETAGLQLGLALPIACYAYIAWYGLRGSRISRGKSTCVEHA
jgi:FHS family L-fucose permease-like MFS transporter